MDEEKEERRREEDNWKKASVVKMFGNKGRGERGTDGKKKKKEDEKHVSRKHAK